MPLDGSSYDTIAKRMLAIFGENGERWGKGNTVALKTDTVCLLGAFAASTRKVSIAELRHSRSPDWIACWANPQIENLIRAIKRKPTKCCGTDMYSTGDIVTLNDRPETTFEDIKKVLHRMDDLEIAALVK